MAQVAQKTPVIATSSQELDGIIAAAIKKIGGSKANDLCRYLPDPDSADHMHHFRLRKMKRTAPQQLANIIQSAILSPSAPKKFPPKRRAPRGSRKKGQCLLPPHLLDRLIGLARTANDKETLSALLPKRDLKSLKRELVSAIRHERAPHELWLSYCEAVASRTQ